MKKILSAFCLLIILTASSKAQFMRRPKADPIGLSDSMKVAPFIAAYQPKLYIDSVGTLPYRLLLPKDYDSTKKYPIIIFLHGSGERGSENYRQLINGGSLFATDSIQQKYPAIVVFPQCPQNSFWSNVKISEDATTHLPTFTFQADGEPTVAMTMLIGLTRQLSQQFSVKNDQVYVMGLSMGGMGTFELVHRMPATFAGAVSFCGGADTTIGHSISKTSWWIFHGAKDDVVAPAFSEAMVYELNKYYNSEVQYTVYAGSKHDCWVPGLKEPELLPWLFQQRLRK